jgi:hypothetical protein
MTRKKCTWLLANGAGSARVDRADENRLYRLSLVRARDYYRLAPNRLTSLLQQDGIEPS